MAQWQARNTPTLVAGQTIAVNKYTVQVERYLSQGTVTFAVWRFCSISSRRCRWFRPCLPRQNGDTSIWHDSSCSQANRGPRRGDADRGQEGGGHHGARDPQIAGTTRLILPRGFSRGTRILSILLTPRRIAWRMAHTRCSFSWSSVPVEALST